MKQCLTLLLRQHLPRHGTTSPLFTALQDQRLARAAAAILQRPEAAHSLADIVGVAGMSRSSFLERFSQAFGQSPLDFVQKVRLHHAAHLLRATDLPIKIVANSVGYASRSHFSRAFKASYGTDPTSYRSFPRTAEQAGASAPSDADE